MSTNDIQRLFDRLDQIDTEAQRRHDENIEWQRNHELKLQAIELGIAMDKQAATKAAEGRGKVFAGAVAIAGLLGTGLGFVIPLFTKK